MNPGRRPAVAAAAALMLLAAGCVSTSRPIPAEWLSVPAAARIGSVSFSDDGKIQPSAAPVLPRLSDGPIRVVSDFSSATLLNGDKVLANLDVIDSLDLSESRGEVAFSAQRKGGFDIALIAMEGGAVHWMPNDPADEVAVQWAPRGNKISYVIRAAGGDVVRTLHIPTSYQFAIPFPGSTIHALAWDAPAERYAVAYSTLDASDRVEVLKYDGEERTMAIPPERQLDAEVVSFAPGAVVLMPRDLRQKEKLPLVVWIADDFGWSDARAALLTNARAAVVVTKSWPSEDLWGVAAGTAWLDPSQTFLVDARSITTRGDRPPQPTTRIVPDTALGRGQYRPQGDIVAVAPAVVQSFAAGYITARLKRATPTNGSSR
jgi:hypothetical protein